MDPLLTALVSLAVALIATIPGFLAYRSTRRKEPAEAAEIITGAAGNIVDRLEKQVSALDKRVTELTVELSNTQADLRVAEGQLLIARGELAVVRIELDAVKEENERLEGFANAAQATILELSALLKKNGVEVDTDGQVPPKP